MKEVYREYRRWLEDAEINIRMRLPGWNVELREHRPGTFELYLGKPLSEKGGDKIFYLTKEQVDYIASSKNFSLMDTLGFDAFGKGPLGA